MTAESLPTNLAAAHAMILAERAARMVAEIELVDARADATGARADLTSTEALIAHLKLAIEKLRWALYGSRSERQARLRPIGARAGEAGSGRDLGRGRHTGRCCPGVPDCPAPPVLNAPILPGAPAARTRRDPGLVVLPVLRIGEAVEARRGRDRDARDNPAPLDGDPDDARRFSCRNCERITQPPAPLHVTPRGFAGPQLLATILFEKFGQHQPLNRQSERFAQEGITLSVSTLADQVGACTTALRPLYRLIEAHVLTAGRLHADDTTVPISAKGKTTTGRIWTYVRDDRPFGGPDPPAALFYASRDRAGHHPERHLAGFGGILQADAYGGYNGLYVPSRAAGPVLPAFCWAHARRGFFELADIARNARRGKKAAAISPAALEAVRRIDALFAIERGLNGRSAAERLETRTRESAPFVADLEAWLRDQRSRLSRSASVAEPIDYMLRRWQAFARFLDDGRICLSNNAAERALRGFALGRRSWLFAGSERGAERAAAIATLIITAKLNDVDPQAWLADVLARIAGHPAQRLHDLLPWNWRPSVPDVLAQAA